MLYGVELVVIVNRSVSDVVVEPRVIVGLARLATGVNGAEPPRTVVVRATVPLKFMILVTLIVEVEVSVGPRVNASGFAEISKPGPITSTSTIV